MRSLLLRLTHLHALNSINTYIVFLVLDLILKIETLYILYRMLRISEMHKLSLLNHYNLFVELCLARIFVILNCLVGLMWQYDLSFSLSFIGDLFVN